MKLTRMHAFLITCLAAIISALILFITPIWACSVAAFFGIIAITYMVNDYLNERSAKKVVEAAAEAELVELEPAPAPAESYGGWDHEAEPGRSMEQLLNQRQPIPRKSAVPLYMEIFGLDESRATNLYRAGFYNIVMLREADTKELAMVKGINPTLARRIRLKANEV